MLSWRLQNVYTRSGEGAAEDVAITTHDFNSPDDWPSSAWATVESAIMAACRAMPERRASSVVHAEMRWYRFNGTPTPGEDDWGDVHRVTPVVGWTNGTGSAFPPQIAITVTERTGFRKNWGRFYLPQYGQPSASGGRVNAVTVDGIAAAWRDAYNACRAAGLNPTVLTSFKTSGGILGGEDRHGAHVSILAVQVDDIYDVQRRRRYEVPLRRTRHALGAPPAE